MAKKKELICRKCANLDKEKSSENFAVCKFQPLPVEVLLDPNLCKKFKEEKAVNNA